MKPKTDWLNVAVWGGILVGTLAFWTVVGFLILGVVSG